MKIFFVSLGCDKNLVDSEVMLGILAKGGHTIVSEESEAEVIVINTCSFIHDAKEESVNTIIEMGELKKQGNLKGIIVTGCLAQLYGKELQKEMPEIDVLLGTTAYEHILEAVNQIAAHKKDSIYESVDFLPHEAKERMVTTGGYTAYLKIGEGCDKHCTYCIIPSLRGRYRSVPMEDVLETAKKLVDDGAKELILVAQETTVYGVDLYQKKMLPQLLKKLCELDVTWIRLLYCYPEEITDELIETMANEPKICHYIDMPIQHSEDTILKKMGRRTNRTDLENTIAKLRRAMPDIAIRTTLITGFPGETEEEYEALYNFVDQQEFERLGVFTYSKEENTPAARMDGQVSQEEKLRRQEELYQLAQEISYEHGQNMIGKKMDVLIDGYLYQDDIYIGRSYMDAPKIDGNVFVKAQEELMSGDVVRVSITGANEYDLMGDVIYEFTK